MKPRTPPAVVWISWCSTCGQPICADRTAKAARGASGCRCAVGRDRVKSVRYVLATVRKGKK